MTNSNPSHNVTAIESAPITTNIYRRRAFEAHSVGNEDLEQR
jgi:hypothetical protein